MSKHPDASQYQGLSELRDLFGGRRGAAVLVCLKAFSLERRALSSFKYIVLLFQFDKLLRVLELKERKSSS